MIKLNIIKAIHKNRMNKTILLQKPRYIEMISNKTISKGLLLLSLILGQYQYCIFVFKIRNKMENLVTK